MAKVIELGNFTQTPSGRGGAAFDAPTSFPNAAARQLEQSSQVTGQNAQLLQATLMDLQTKKNEAQVKDADVALSSELRRIMLDPEQGYLNQQGKNAVDLRESVEKQIAEAINNTGKQFDNPETKSMWASVARQRQENAMSQILSHAAKETNVYRVKSGAARIDSAMQDAAGNWQDEKARSVAKSTMLAEVDELAALQGFDADQLKQARLDATTAMHGQVISSMIAADNTTAASEYLKTNEKEIEPGKLGPLRDALEKAALRKDSIDLYDRLTESGKGIEEQLSEVKQLYKDGKVSPELRDATEQRLWAKWQDDRRLESYAEEQANDALAGAELAAGENLKAVNQGGVRGLISSLFPGAVFTSGARAADHPLSIKNPSSFHNIKNGGTALDIRKIPGVTFNEFVGRLKGAGLNIVEAIDEYKNPSKHATGGHWHIAWRGARATPNGNPPKVKTNPQLYADLLDLYADDPIAFAQGFSVAEFSAEIAPGDLKKLAEKAASIKRDMAKNSGKSSAYKAGIKSLTAELAAAGIDTSPAPGDTDMAKFKAAYQSEIEKEEKKVGRALTEREAIAIGKGLLAEGYIERDYWLDKSVRYYEVKPSERDRFYQAGGTSRRSRRVPYEQIPSSQRDAMIRSWNRTNPGKTPTRKNIEDTYAIFLERTRGR